MYGVPVATTTMREYLSATLEFCIGHVLFPHHNGQWVKILGERKQSSTIVHLEGGTVNPAYTSPPGACNSWPL